MRIHLGAPREKLFAVVGDGAVYDTTGRQLTFNTRRQIKWLYGISWRIQRGFVFVGVQFHAKQDGES